ncbi:hypothetical protein BBO99_00002550 [Phytophthora kernoviae]|uniref:Uncharacterized protein n=2 Tax=Phytophthora kernoviae TaxID=325452 RepID=A0A3R7JA05_9STRA|nr:hypothetical protein G195_004326 [Phytophthora kernoviae 00238/432]KAG2527311.1 hypothetical protein JM16_003491 [Phytophthora kernoviae]KAG2530307.1 hypothetical protein JM18_002243 [Phytophthora kernoviae]RLN20948.1 hypothetical protein BBI17_002449 [Phytophthora kernoviae]RLN82865.1 hypothetical protein BBO99_00002550 [Phytophthora kernoviae]
MYTKMTSTGSSLIVNPRTISKELEVKISAAIAEVIASHDVAKLTTKLVRQAVEKEVHVSLTSHKDVLKRLMHQELRKLKAKKVAKRAVPEPWKNAKRRESVVRALNRVYQLVREAPMFPTWGLHAIQSLYDLQTVERGQVLRLATLYARLIGAMWLKEDRHEDWAPGSVPTPSQVALQCFEGSSNLVHVRRGLAFLLVSQHEDGSWQSESTQNDTTQRYFSTVHALWALSEPHRAGFAPAFPEATQILELHLNADIGNIGNISEDATLSFIDGARGTSSDPVSNYTDTDAEVAAATASGPSANEDVATQVSFLQGLLEQHGNVKNVSAGLATHVLKTLTDMALTVDILKNTGIGRTINKLRKHTTPAVAKGATSLVAKWKKDLL